MLLIRWDALKQRSRRGALLTNTSTSTSSVSLQKMKAKTSKTGKKSDQAPPSNLNVRLNPLLRAALPDASGQPLTPKGNAVPSPPPLPAEAGGSSNQGVGKDSLGQSIGSSGSFSGSSSLLTYKEKRLTGSRLSSGDVPVRTPRGEAKFRIEEDICNKPFNKDVLQQNKATLVIFHP